MDAARHPGEDDPPMLLPGADPVPQGGAAQVAPSDERARAVCDEFRQLSVTAQQHFAALRLLPPSGPSPWRQYFARAFQVMSRLWKFQQEHRQILQTSPRVALQRCDIGDMASKIGQLYFHFYMRSSDLACLREAFSFYDAIRSREYFRGIQRLPGARAWLVRELRFYARFALVALMLNRYSVVGALIGEVRTRVAHLTAGFGEAEAREWALVLDELAGFLQRDHAPELAATASADAADTLHQVIAGRLLGAAAGAEAAGSMHVEHAIVVGALFGGQAKFSDITVDMLRVAQLLEFDYDLAPPAKPAPLADAMQGLSLGGSGADAAAAAAQARQPPPAAQQPQQPQQQEQLHQASRAVTSSSSSSSSSSAASSPASSPASSASSSGVPAAAQQHAQAHGAPATPRKNPQKALLFQPSAMSLLLHACSAQQQLSDRSAALLLYLSCGASPAELAANGPASAAGEGGGAGAAPAPAAAAAPLASALHLSGQQLPAARLGDYVLTPEDVVPLLRRPLALVADGVAARSLESLAARAQPPFHTPVLLVLSGRREPRLHGPHARAGHRVWHSLLTAFLHSPVRALCALFGATRLTASAARLAHETLQSALDRLAPLVATLPLAHDPLLLRMYLRAALFAVCLSELAPAAEADAACAPLIFPPPPRELATEPSLRAALRAAAELLGGASQLRA